MANIYSHKDSNIRKTYILFVGFLFVVVGLGWVFAMAYNDPSIVYIAVVFSMIMSVASYWFSDKIVLSLARAKSIEKKDNPELYRIVENLAITAGLPTPKIYIIEEAAPNAFATGRDPSHSAVAVTTGLLAKLDKAELEGVMAHELSHIGNRDILVGTVAVILVGFIVLLSDFFLRTIGRGRDRDRVNIYFVFIGIALAILAPLIGALIRLAISRKRESLADASGALLTRYPQGLASALQKIAVDPTPVASANNATSHLWLSDPFRNQTKTSFIHKLFLTHPPIEERIKALKEMQL